LSESIGKVEKKPFTQMSLLKTGNLHRIAVFDQRGPPAWYLGGSQSLSSLLTNLWVRDFMPKVTENTQNEAETTPKKRGTINPLDILSNFFTISA
jgi:hypothetical protein